MINKIDNKITLSVVCRHGSSIGSNVSVNLLSDGDQLIEQVNTNFIVGSSPIINGVLLFLIRRNGNVCDVRQVSKFITIDLLGGKFVFSISGDSICS